MKAPDVGPPVCEDCGYSLAGHSWDDELCPECGIGIDLSSHFRRRPALPLWRVAISGCLPTTIAGAAFLAVLKLVPDSELVVLAASWPVWAGGWMILAVLIPHTAARSYAESHVLRPRRTAVRRLLTAAIIAMNSVQSVAIAVYGPLLL